MRVLFVCSAGRLRSPTAADYFRCAMIETRSRGCEVRDENALTAADGEWAQLVVAMERRLVRYIEKRIGRKPDVVLAIPDRFDRGDAKLIKLLEEQFSRWLFDEVMRDRA